MGGNIHQSDSLDPGTMIDDKYRVERILGRGAMGRVVLARDLDLDRPVAIKVVDPTRVDPEKAKQRFKTEAIAMARIRHPNVVQVYAFGYHKEAPYLVTEYVPGETVGEMLRRSGKLHIDVALGALEQVALGLGAVHHAGLVHRDVKPQNLLVGPEFRVQITDFGLARLERSTPEERYRMGTPYYMAPEILRGKRLPPGDAFLSDIYSLGITAFELLTGKLPFLANDFQSLARLHLKAPVPTMNNYVDGLGDLFDAAMATAMAKDPYARFASAGDFAKALRGARDLEEEAFASSAKRILVVDDDPGALALCSIAFESAFEESIVLTASDGLAALELAKAQRPDLMVVDLNMPRLDGVQLIEAVRATRQLSEVAILVVSGAVSPGRRARLEELDVPEVLEKPVPVRTLIHATRRLLRRGWITGEGPAVT